jgi:hypothetical protein
MTVLDSPLNRDVLAYLRDRARRSGVGADRGATGATTGGGAVVAAGAGVDMSGAEVVGVAAAAARRRCSADMPQAVVSGAVARLVVAAQRGAAIIGCASPGQRDSKMDCANDRISVWRSGVMVWAALLGPAAALALVEELDLRRYHPFHAVRADLLRRLGRAAEAVEAYDAAIAGTGNEVERAFLRTRREAQVQA